MRKCLSMLAVVVLTSVAAGDEFEKSRLRQVVQFPAPSIDFGVGFSGKYGFYLKGYRPNEADEIKSLRKAMKGDASDAERYYRMAILYGAFNPKAKEPIRKCLRLLRRQIKIDPNNGYLHAQLGRALARQWAFENDERQRELNKEAEVFLRKGVKFAPKDWRCWVALGEYLYGNGMLMFTNKQNHFHIQGIEAGNGQPRFKADFLKKAPTPKQVKKFAALCAEARACFDKAVAAAPDNPQPYLKRTGFSYIAAIFEQSIGIHHGKQDKTEGFPTAEMVSDLQEAADRRPNNPAVIGMAILLTLARNRSTPVVQAAAKPDDPFLKKSFNRLEKLAEKKGTRAAEAAEILRIYHLAVDQDDQRARRAFERAVALNPARDLAWDFLFMLVATSEGTKAATALCERRLKAKDNAHNRFLLASFYFATKEYAKSEKQLAIALKREANDLPCNLALAAVLLRRDDPKSLARAGEQLRKIEKLLKGKASASDRSFYTNTRAIHLALTGHSKQAKKLLEGNLKRNPRNSYARRVLKELAILESLPPTPDGAEKESSKKEGGGF